MHVIKIKPKVHILMASDDGVVRIEGSGLDHSAQPADVRVRDKLVRVVDVKRRLTTDVAFSEFGEVITDYPVIKGLKLLRDSTNITVRDLGRFLR